MTETTENPSPKTRGKSTKASAKKPLAVKNTTAGAKTADKPAVRKTAPKKSAAPAAKTAQKGLPMSAEERRRLIAEAAYLRAEQRGFVGGDPVQDWMDAEADLNSRLRSPTH
jgi:hypothetical protein